MTLCLQCPRALPPVNIGVFISGVINFIIMAFVVFMIVKMINKIREPKGKPAPAAPTTKSAVLQIRDRHRGNPLPALHICAGCHRRRAAKDVKTRPLSLQAGKKLSPGTIIAVEAVFLCCATCKRSSQWQGLNLDKNRPVGV